MLRNQKTIVKVIGLEKSFHLRKVLNNINFEIKNGERIGLVGNNGTGKTTLANLLFGRLTSDQGLIEKSSDLRIGYLSQSIDYEVSHFLHSKIGIEENEVYQHASGLGLNKVFDWEENRLTHLSGGEKLKLALSMIWATKPDFLILDEPTNHLDFIGIKWLVSELEKFNGPVLIISHDRHFLDKTVNRIFELEDSEIQFYNGNYSDYREKKEQLLANHRHHYTVQQRQIEKIQTQMEQLNSWSEKAHRESTKQEGFKEYYRVKAKKLDKQVKSKMKRLENELSKHKVEKPKEEAAIRFQFDSRGKRGKRVIEAKRLKKTFDDRILFQDSHFYINHGERIGLLGENGCGKTTLLKMILGDDQSFDGELWLSDSVKIAYLSQDVADLPVDKTAIEALGFTDRDRILQARTYLANLGLKEQLITKQIGTLSLGDRTRVKLVDMLMQKYDVLILDEPTNHLDLPSREQLEKTLAQFTGTIIIVSHDFYFLNKLCDRLVVFEKQSIRRVEMKPEVFLNKNNKNENDRHSEELMIIENRIATVLGELSLTEKNDPKYLALEREFNRLLNEKRNF